MVNGFLNNYFGFNKQQRNGLLVLSIISLLLLVIRIIYPSFIKPNNIIVENLPLIERKIDSSFDASQQNFSNHFSENKITLNLFVFDPNTVSLEQLIQLGFKEKLAKRFLKFRDKGFVFKQKNDLQKVYGISENFYSQLEPYIIIEKKVVSKIDQNSNNNKKEAIIAVDKKQTNKVELNAADSLALLNLNGIGPSFAKRILKYRNMLGGFNTIDQLKEVYGFTDDLFEKLKPFVLVDANNIKKININKDDFKTVNKHPYLSYELTKTIFDWRRKTVITVTNLKDILNDNSVYNKLIPYINFD